MKYYFLVLQKIEDPSLFRIAITTLGEISRGTQLLFSKYLDKIIPKFIEMLKVILNKKDPNFDRETKLCIFISLADISLSSENSLQSYLNDIIILYDLAFKGCLMYQYSVNFINKNNNRMMQDNYVTQNN